MTETQADPFAGWTIEEADPDVGIFGESVVHDCDENYAQDDPQDATPEVAMRAEGEQVVVTTTFTCPACSATTSFEERMPKEWFE